MQKLLIILFFTFGILACSQFSQSPTSKSWHNLNAKYNSLMFGEDKLLFVRQTLERQRESNFSDILPIFEPIDSTKLDTLKPYLEEVIRLSSKLAEKHSNSKYLDESYILLGKARLLKGEIFNAMETFKYVNANSENESNQNTAKIWLLRSYIENGDNQTANQVSELIKKSSLSKGNIIEYFLVTAYLNQINNENAIAVVLLDEAIKLMPKSEDKARYLFIAGQLYQSLNRSDLAIARYEEVPKSRPPYELEFNAKLNRLLIGQRPEQSRNIYAKMLKEYKNEELKDQIYLRMAKLEESNKNFPKAFEYYNRSLTTTLNNNLKSGIYYNLSKIHLNEFKHYKTSADYLDSTLNLIDSTNKNYRLIKAEADYLRDFVKFSTVIEQEDSLQNLSKLNPDQLNSVLEKEAKRIIEENEKEELAKNKEDKKGTDVGKYLGRDIFVLYDPFKYEEGKRAFQAKWGKRNLSDNWRISSKQSGNFEIKIRKEKVNPEEIRQKEKEQEIAQQSLINNKVAELKANLLTSENAFSASNKKLEEAYFGLGKLYKLKLQNNDLANETLKKLLSLYPETNFKPEALYLLALANNGEERKQFETEIINNYPQTSFARLIKSGNLEMTTEKESEAESAYKRLYSEFSNGNYTSSLEGTNTALTNYIGSKVEDKIAFLRILSLAKIGENNNYKLALEDFLNSYSSSNLVARAKSMYAELSP